MKNIAVLMGGPSTEHEISLQSSANFIKLLDSAGFISIPVLINQDSTWTLVNNNTAITPTELAPIVDCAVIGLHGQYGEDGTVQKILEKCNIPYTGSDSIASTLRANKFATKQLLNDNGIQTPRGCVITNPTELHDFEFPIFIKPVNGGSSVDSAIIRSAQELSAFWDSRTIDYDEMLVEEYIIGKEITCGVIDNRDDKDVYALEPIYIKIPDSAEFFDLAAKYSPETQEICPSGLDSELVQEIQILSEKVHRLIGARDYSRVDMILHPTRGLFVLELNSLPGFTATSLLPKELAYAGISGKEFITHLINQVVKRN